MAKLARSTKPKYCFCEKWNASTSFCLLVNVVLVFLLLAETKSPLGKSEPSAGFWTTSVASELIVPMSAAVTSLPVSDVVPFREPGGWMFSLSSLELPKHVWMAWGVGPFGKGSTGFVEIPIEGFPKQIPCNVLLAYFESFETVFDLNCNLKGNGMECYICDMFMNICDQNLVSKRSFYINPDPNFWKLIYDCWQFLSTVNACYAKYLEFSGKENILAMFYSPNNGCYGEVEIYNAKILFKIF